MLAIATLLILSIGSTALIQSSFAAKSSTTTTVEKIPNSKELTIDSLTVYIKTLKAKTKSASIEVQVVQDGKTLDSAIKSLGKNDGLSNRKYAGVTLTFESPVKVEAKDFKIVIIGNGIVPMIWTDAKNKSPGFVESEDGKKQFLKKDVTILINNEQLRPSMFEGDGTSTGSEEEENSGNPPSGSSTTINLTVEAKNSKDSSPISGMWIGILQESVLVKSSFTTHTFELPKGDYMVYMDDYNDAATGTTYKFVKWQDSTQGKFRSATLNSDETFTAIYDVEGPGASVPPTDNSGGTTDGGTSTSGDGSSTGSDTGTTTDGGANTVTVKSQLLDSTATSGFEAEIRGLDGVTIKKDFTPATFTLEPNKQVRVIMYWTSDTFFRHWTDGGLHRYHYVTPTDSGQTITAQYEKIALSQQAKLTVLAKTSDGVPIGGTTGTAEDQTLSAEPGLEVQIAPPMSTTPYTAGFTGGSEASPFTLVKGQSYTVIMTEYGQYKFNHWEDNGSNNSARVVPMNSDLRLTAVYDLIQ